METSRRLFKEFLSKSYISGLQLLVYNTPVPYAKTLWFIFLACVVTWTHLIILNLTQEYLVQPTEIHMSPNLVHVSNSPFPAIGVCTANKVSKSLLRNYANKIYQHQKINSSDSPQLAQNADDMAQRLLILTEFYLNPHDEPELDKVELSQLHWLLSSYYNDTEYSVRDILRQLSPECSDLVIRGIVYGAPVNASQLFIKRPTSTSVCCIFNYRRRSYSRIEALRVQDDAEMAALPKVVFESNSILNSVQFVLQDAPEEEYTYTYLSNRAFQLIIFPQEDYATVQSTAWGEILVDPNTIVEIPIQPKFFDSSESLRHISPETRYCYYPEEGRKLLNRSYYSMDECLLFCRVESMLKHCGCVSSPMASSSLSLKFCTLPDLPCLMKWKKIWYGYNEFSYLEKRIDQEAQRQCVHCLPSCNGVTFDITSNVAPLRGIVRPTGYLTGLLKGLNNKRPLAIIKLYFKLRFAQATKTEIVSTWVVLLNRFGGILSLMYGFSIVSYIEIVYYLTGKWFVYYYRAFRNKKVFKNKSILPTNFLYWQEVIPKILNYSIDSKEKITRDNGI